jgi:hypothetical protein
MIVNDGLPALLVELIEARCWKAPRNVARRMIRC